MKLKESAFSLSYIVLTIFLIIFIIQKNWEFLLYLGSIYAFTGFLHFIDKKIKLIPLAKWGYFICLLMHMLGGSLVISGTKLYSYILIDIVGSPYNILKYDQAMHLFCYGVITLIMYSFLIKIASAKKQKLIFYTILILAASSIGAINEIIEFSTVILFNSTGVGGYYNTALDLVANLIGSITAAVIIFLKSKN
ncbi:MAG: DUF2238 domain-containing protein [Nanobdellota archaeon]